MIFLNNLFLEIKKFFLRYVFQKKYYRVGKCKGCGRCCQKIYITHANDLIKTEEEFEYLKSMHYFYDWLKVVDKDETGLIFECTKLNKETGKCTAYNQRPSICRQYPMEEIFLLGGSITENCGFKFIPIVSFEKVLKKTTKELSKKEKV